jgi:hypothetical protein
MKKCVRSHLFSNSRSDIHLSRGKILCQIASVHTSRLSNIVTLKRLGDHISLPDCICSCIQNLQHHYRWKGHNWDHIFSSTKDLTFGSRYYHIVLGYIIVSMVFRSHNIYLTYYWGHNHFDNTSQTPAGTDCRSQLLAIMIDSAGSN